MKSFYRDLRVGVVGGGQLGRMLIQAAIDLNVHISALDPAAEAPAAPYAHRFVQGSLTDYDTVYQFGQACDLLTIEIENVNTEALAALQAEGKTVYPDPAIIRLIQDKRVQKQFYRDHGLPTADFVLVENRAEVMAQADRLPAVNKLGRAGYDGRGVQVLRTEADLDKAFDAPGLLEDLVPFEREIAVIVARNPQGETATYPLVEMVFHPTANLVEYLIAPADLPVVQAVRAHEIAVQTVEALAYVGLMAVEMFVAPGGEILINEVAPRPHNSGHHSIRACYTSQYEQHLRAILGMPLGDTRQHTPAAMVNLLGAEGHTGPTRYQGVEKLLAIPGAYPHFYGKSTTKPYRKMGHVTILDPDRAALDHKVEQVKAAVQVVAAAGEA
ncbi:MAG: 5-(carboxyamino)imidazole ribonucleotide synthase [Bacteroidetes bacterium]|nr:MAG: 5-(carboxyamino)imidazole ribonucleotide synthase [Bacteroidota bacterium]